MNPEFKNKCLITGLNAEEVKTGRDMVFSYKIKVNNNWTTLNLWKYVDKWLDGKVLEDLQFGVGEISLNQAINNAVKNQRYILSGLLLNNKWPLRDDEILGMNKIKDILINSNYPKSPKEKKEFVFNVLFSKNKLDGQQYSLDSDNIHKYYLRSSQEYKFYLEDLSNDGYIKLYPNNQTFLAYSITYKGLNYGISLNEEGYNSNICFVAMSFSKEDLQIFTEAIEPACNKLGFIARRIDGEHYDPEKSVNDAMIALMKKSKFCIADFTGQKHGVYFEAGYCLGRGKKVIYTCSRKDFEDSHFDTNHFPHIVYENLDEMRDGLIKKIEAWIL